MLVKTQTPPTTLTNLWSNGSPGKGRKRSCPCPLHLNPSDGGCGVNGRSKRYALHRHSKPVIKMRLQIMKIVRAIRQGRIVPNKPKTSSKELQFYSIWSSEPSSSAPPPLPAPKPPLPTNDESYNPPEEYLPTEDEKKEWESQDPEDRERDFLPQKYSSLRHVPGYDKFIQERFSRQLDLYLAPRIQRVKLNINPESLIPKLPSPSSLKPFPNYRSLRFTHPKGRTRCASVSPDGAWVVSGDEDGNVCLWEVNVGCEVKRWKFNGKIGSVEWCPRTDVCYFAVGVYVQLYPHNLRLPNSCRFQRRSYSLCHSTYCGSLCTRVDPCGSGSGNPPSSTSHTVTGKVDECIAGQILSRSANSDSPPSSIFGNPIAAQLAQEG